MENCRVPKCKVTGKTTCTECRFSAYRAAISINKMRRELVAPLHPDARNVTLKAMEHGDAPRELLCGNRVQRPEQIEFEVLVRRRIAEDCHLK